MHTIARGLATLALLLVHPCAAIAQGPGPLVTDRPDQTESASLVPLGYVQFEAGWGFTQRRDGGVRLRSHTIPAALARVGLWHRLEGRVGFAGWMRAETVSTGGTTIAAGVGDLDVGFKYQLAAALGMRPQIALIGTLTLPTGEADFGGERADPSVRLAFANELSDRVGLGYNVGAMWTSMPDVGGATRTLVDALYTVAFGFTVNDMIGAFAESFGTFALSEGAASEHLLDGGFTLLLRDNLQLDISAGAGLNGAADDWFVGGGFAVRVPR